MLLWHDLGGGPGRLGGGVVVVPAARGLAGVDRDLGLSVRTLFHIHVAVVPALLDVSG